MLFIVIICLFGIIYSNGFDFALADRNLETETYPTAPGNSEVPGPDTELSEFIKYLFNFGIGIGGILVFIMLLYAGILWITSAGNPAAVSKAKSKILGGVAGLTLLFLSYIIIVAINPGLTLFKDVPYMEPTTGIYIIGTISGNGTEEQDKRLYQGDISGFRDNFVVNSVEFISEPDELYSVFAYDKKNFEGSAVEVINVGKGSTANISGKQSISFFWTKPGVYLYEEPNLKGLRPPKHCVGAVNDLDKDKWDNKAQSIRFDNKYGSDYGAVLFADNDFEGRCGYAYKQNVMDLSAETGRYIHPIGNQELSSLYVVKIPKDISGSVAVYDSVACKGRSKTFTPTGVMVFDSLTKENCSIGNCLFDKIQEDDQEKELHRNINSIKIKGDFYVLISSKPYFGENAGLSKDEQPMALEPRQTDSIHFLNFEFLAEIMSPLLAVLDNPPDIPPPPDPDIPDPNIPNPNAPNIEDCEESDFSCGLFYVKKKTINECVELKFENVYESDFCGKKIESMMIIPAQ